MTDISLKFRCEYRALTWVAALIRRLPRELSLAVGARLGQLAFWLLPKRRKLAVANLQQAFPRFDRKQLAGLARANFIHVGVSAAEMLRMDLFNAERGDLDSFFDVDLTEMRKAHALGRGVIMLSGHFGFWEVGSFPLQQHGYQVDLVAKPMKNPLVDGYFEKLRKVYGHDVLDSRKGARRILKSLQQGHLVAVLLDQHISPPGAIPVDFFGRKAYTTTAITNLAMKYQIPVVPTFCQRLKTNRYKLWAEPLLLLAGEGEQALRANTQLLTEKIEAGIRNDITQWFWMHKRWRVPADQQQNHESQKDLTGE